MLSFFPGVTDYTYMRKRKKTWKKSMLRKTEEKEKEETKCRQTHDYLKNESWTCLSANIPWSWLAPNDWDQRTEKEIQETLRQNTCSKLKRPLFTRTEGKKFCKHSNQGKGGGSTFHCWCFLKFKPNRSLNFPKFQYTWKPSSQAEESPRFCISLFVLPGFVSPSLPEEWELIIYTYRGAVSWDSCLWEEKEQQGWESLIFTLWSCNVAHVPSFLGAQRYLIIPNIHHYKVVRRPRFDWKMWTWEKLLI